MQNTARSYLHSSGQNTGTCQTEGSPLAITVLASPCGHAVKMVQHTTTKNKSKHERTHLKHGTQLSEMVKYVLYWPSLLVNNLNNSKVHCCYLYPFFAITFTIRDNYTAQINKLLHMLNCLCMNVQIQLMQLYPSMHVFFLLTYNTLNSIHHHLHLEQCWFSR